jgi:hypothetical protein
MMLGYQNGVTVSAVLLATNDQTMRIVVEGETDAIELLRAGDLWWTEYGEAVEIDALLQVPGTVVPAFCAEIRPRTTGAGSNFA